MQTQGHVALFDQHSSLTYGLNAFPEFPVLDAPIAIEQDFHMASHSQPANSKTLAADAATAVDPPPGAGNQEQIAALVNSREKEVTELQATLAVPLAAFNAKFIWHCIMNIERDCE